jgi:hypothetical protein
MLKSEKIVVSQYPEVDLDGNEWMEDYGWSVLESHPMAEWIEGVALFVGNREVRTEMWENQILEGRVPMWLCARTYPKDDGSGRKWGSFICGVDLLSNGKIWTGTDREECDTPEEAWNKILAYAGEEFYLVIEEPLPV